MLRRRRPLLRGAAVGAAGYAIGKRAQRGQEDELEDEGEPESTAISDSEIEELRKLAQLKDEGILTDEEFEAQKQKLLQGG